MSELSSKIRSIICEYEQNYVPSDSDSYVDYNGGEFKTDLSNEIEVFSDSITKSFLRATQDLYKNTSMKEILLESSIKRNIKDAIKRSKKRDQKTDYAVDILKTICIKYDIDLYIHRYNEYNKTEYSLYEPKKKNEGNRSNKLGKMALFPFCNVVNNLSVPGTNDIFTYSGKWGKGLYLYVHKQTPLTVSILLKEIYKTVYLNRVARFSNERKNIDQGFLRYLNDKIGQNTDFEDVGRIEHSDQLFLTHLGNAIEINMLNTDFGKDDNLYEAQVNFDIAWDELIGQFYLKGFNTTAHASALLFPQSKDSHSGKKGNGYIPMSIYNSNSDTIPEKQEVQGNHQNKENGKKTQIIKKPNLQYLIWLAEKDMNGFTRHCQFSPIDKRYRQDTQGLCLLIYCGNVTRQNKDLELLKNALFSVSKDVGGEAVTVQTKNDSITLIHDFDTKQRLVQTLVDQNKKATTPFKKLNQDLHDQFLMVIPFINEFFNAQTNDDQIINLFEQDSALDSITQCIRNIYIYIYIC